MRVLLFLCTAFFFASSGAQASLHITNDQGGRIGTYVDKYQALRHSGETVVIDGLCASACTIVLGAIPRERICVTSNANLGFHAAWDMGPGGQRMTNAAATDFLMSSYPSPVKNWIKKRGGLTPQMIFLRGKALAAMYPTCR